MYVQVSYYCGKSKKILENVCLTAGEGQGGGWTGGAAGGPSGGPATGHCRAGGESERGGGEGRAVEVEGEGGGEGEGGEGEGARGQQRYGAESQVLRNASGRYTTPYNRKLPREKTFVAKRDEIDSVDRNFTE